MTAAPADSTRDPAWAELMSWRKAQRQRLLALRAAMSIDARHAATQLIEINLDRTVGDLSGRIVAVYWPIQGEPNLRRWMERLVDNGATCALPVVVDRRAALAFRAWQRGDRLVRGLWNIPVPATGADVVPDVVVAPVVGFDPACYRLGYGGGYYDRTLAALPRRPFVVGVGLAAAALPTIRPRAHDMPLDAVVTERDVFVRPATS